MWYRYVYKQTHMRYGPRTNDPFIINILFFIFNNWYYHPYCTRQTCRIINIIQTHFDPEGFSRIIIVIDEKQEKDRFPFSIDPRVTSQLTCHDSRELLVMKKYSPTLNYFKREKKQKRNVNVDLNLVGYQNYSETEF